jgi:CRISPR-associated protein Csm3
MFELKTEIAVDRGGRSVVPRVIERVSPGPRDQEATAFSVGLAYFVTLQAFVEEDIANLLWALALLEDDSLGGGGSRGAGAVTFRWERLAARSQRYYAASPEERDRFRLEEVFEGPWSTAALQAAWPERCGQLARLWKEA